MLSYQSVFDIADTIDRYQQIEAATSYINIQRSHNFASAILLNRKHFTRTFIRERFHLTLRGESLGLFLAV